MYISSFPTLHVSHFFRKKKVDQLTFPLNLPEATYCFRGANAIFHGIKMLDLKPKDTVLVPAYHCGVELGALSAANIKIKYYNITKSLKVDLKDIKANVDKNTKAVFIIHYFGFPQPIKEIQNICQTSDLLLIEDCAHALYSKSFAHFLGQSGDMSIFSFQKSLPVPDGGALILNKKEDSGIKCHPIINPSKMATLRGLILLYLEGIRMFHPLRYKVFNWIFVSPSRWILRILRKSSSTTFHIDTPSTWDFDIDVSQKGMSSAARKILDVVHSDYIIRKRRDNYYYMLNRIKQTLKDAIVFDELPKGVCPLFFPLLVVNRERLQARLNDYGIQTFIFGKTLHASLPHKKYPNAELWAQQNLCLPIHQDIDYVHIDFMVKILTYLHQSKFCN